MNKYSDNIDEKIDIKCAKIMEAAQNKITKIVEGYLADKLIEIQKKYFYRHSICFIDCMGSATIDIRTRKQLRHTSSAYGAMDDRLTAIFQEIAEIHDWYLGMADDYHITAEEILISP